MGAVHTVVQVHLATEIDEFSMSTVADRADLVTTNRTLLQVSPPTRSGEYVEFRTSQNVVQHVSKRQTMPRFRSTVRTARVPT